MIVTGREVASWVLSPHGGEAGEDFNAIGWQKDDELIAGFAVNEWNGVNCFVHIRLDGYTPRKFWFAMVDWVYNQMGCARMTAPVSASNNDCIKLLDRMGWTREATLPDSAYDGSDLIFFTWKKEDCFLLSWENK
jgi:RimJ/RimL family protein N-acetyltransferase